MLVERLQEAIDAETTAGDSPTKSCLVRCERRALEGRVVRKMSDDATPADAVATMVEGGMTFEQIGRVWTSLGGDIGALRGECEKILLDAENRVAPRRKASLGLELLELLRGSPSDVAAIAARVAVSLREELDDPPERFRDPVSYALMDDPVVIETGHVFDRSSVFDARGEFRFEACPMTRRDIAASAYPVVFLKKELIEHKQRRFDAVMRAARGIAVSTARRELLGVAEVLLERLGSGLYIHRAAAYWELMLESAEASGESVLDVLSALAAKESVEKLDSSVPVRALFDRVSEKLVGAGVATREDIEAITVGEMTTEELFERLESANEEGGRDRARRLAKAWIQRQGVISGAVMCEAAQDGHDAVVRALMEAGADVNKATDDGQTPLLLAAEDGHEAVAQLLKDAGAA